MESAYSDHYAYDKNGAGKLIGVSVGQLRKLLEQFDDDTLVILQKDPEGNGYSP